MSSESVLGSRGLSSPSCSVSLTGSFPTRSVFLTEQPLLGALLPVSPAVSDTDPGAPLLPSQLSAPFLQGPADPWWPRVPPFQLTLLPASSPLFHRSPTSPVRSQGARAGLLCGSRGTVSQVHGRACCLNWWHLLLMSPYTMSPQEHVQKVFQKQEGMEEMFHRRQASLKKLAAKQTRPVQPVAPRPEALTKSPCPSPGVCRHHPSRPLSAL